jgi:hypothetical protein
MTRNLLTAVRLQLKMMGYDPIPLKANKKPYFGWPKEPNDPDAIRQWSRQLGCVATGIRLYRSPGLIVFDLDIRIAAIRDAILKAYTERWPAFMRDCVRRHSGGVTLALFGQCETSRGTVRSGRWRDEDAAEGTKDQAVEVFTQHSKTQMVVDGVHSEGRTYGYHGRPLWEVPPRLLPAFPPEDISAAVTIANEAMRAAGLVQKASAVMGKHIVYDLQADTPIMLADGDELTLAELERELKAGPPTRTMAYPPWDPESVSARVSARMSRDGLSLYDFKTETSHRWAWRALPETFTDMVARLRALGGSPR